MPAQNIAEPPTHEQTFWEGLLVYLLGSGGHLGKEGHSMLGLTWVNGDIVP